MDFGLCNGAWGSGVQGLGGLRGWDSGLWARALESS